MGRNSGAFLGKPKGSVERNFAVVGERARSVSGGEKAGMKKVGVQLKEGRVKMKGRKEGRKEAGLIPSYFYSVILETFFLLPFYGGVINGSKECRIVKLPCLVTSPACE